MKTKIAKDLLKIQAVFLRPDEPFTWASGIKSPIYCDNRLTLSDHQVRLDVENGLAELVKTHYPEAEVLMGTSTAGIAHAAFTRGPIWSKERVPSEGMVTEVLPVEDWGCPLSLGARTAAAGADRDSRAEQVRHRAAKRFFIGGSSWRGKGNRLLETGRKCCYFSRVL